MWDFCFEPEFPAKLGWADSSVRAQVEPVDRMVTTP